MTTATDKKKDAAYAVLIEKFQKKYQNYTREDVKKSIRLEPTICNFNLLS